MSYVVAAPEFVTAAAHDLATVASNLSSANAAALAPTSGVMAAGADEVSATIAALFGAHAQAYQALSAQAALFHQQFVQLMSGGAAEYAATEAANASPLETAQQGALSVAGAAPAGSVSAGTPAATTPPPHRPQDPTGHTGRNPADGGFAGGTDSGGIHTGQRADSGGAGAGHAGAGRHRADGDGVANADRGTGSRGGRTRRRAG